MDHQVTALCADIYQSLAVPLGTDLAKALSDRDWATIASQRVDPSSFTDPEEFARHYQAAELLRKAEFLPHLSPREKAASAQKSFWDSERVCFSSNKRLYPLLHDPVVYGEGVRSMVDRARKYIRRVLGKCPDDVLGRFGPGSTFSDRGNEITVPHKINNLRPALTSKAWPFLFPFFGTAWGKAVARGKEGAGPIVVRGNRFTTVPKDSVTDRGICIEPSLNLFYQLPYGAAIKKRLAREGINLYTGQQSHREWARRASINDDFCTIDLSSASDTVCSVLVELLLPRSWFDVLDSLRSPRTLVNDRWVLLEKFSSMGNGFTFELESLIFAAIIHALDPSQVSGRDFSVYGDDIIVKKHLGEDLLSALSFFGFIPNRRKTFLSGPFRESCGGDFFLGVDVSPFRLKESWSGPEGWISVANKIRRWSDVNQARRHDLQCVWLRVVETLPSSIQSCRGPSELGDLVICDDEARWTTKVRNSIRYIRCYKPARFRRVSLGSFPASVQMAALLYGSCIGHRGRGAKALPPHVVPRDAVLGYKTGWVPWS